jgi:hypothetical protein
LRRRGSEVHLVLELGAHRIEREARRIAVVVEVLRTAAEVGELHIAVEEARRIVEEEVHRIAAGRCTVVVGRGRGAVAILSLIMLELTRLISPLSLLLRWSAVRRLRWLLTVRRLWWRSTVILLRWRCAPSTLLRWRSVVPTLRGLLIIVIP